MTSIERATRKDWLWPAIFIALGIVGALVARQYFFRAFPEASIDLRIARDEITRLSDGFLRGRGLDPTGYRHVTVFDSDDIEQAKTYLERELGLEEANRVMATRVNIWRWRTRWIKPPEKEEFSVWLTTAGKLVGFEHQVEENREGARLIKAEAQRIAEVFLRAERGLDLGRFDLVTDDVKERPRRLDYTFTWEERGVKLKDATVRMSVTVLGDRVGGFREFLKIPEQWTRDYERMRSRNNLLSTIDSALYVLLLLAAVVTIVQAAGRRRMRWQAVLTIGVVAGLLYMLEFWNEFGLVIRFMPTNITYEAWSVIFYGLMLLVGAATTLYVTALAASGEPLYRELAPERVALGRLFTLPGLRSKEFFTSTLIGYGMAGMHIGLVVLFYVMARRLGAWAPLDVNYNNAVSTPLPWIAPLATAVFAATTEEFAFRLFAIPLLLKWLKSRWLAVLIPAFMWGFLHTAYPQQPAWIRGVEVGMIGVVAGWVFLRFGILATLVWHYTVDAVLIGFFLLRSENLSFRIAGALVGDAVLLPLVIGGVFFLQSRGFLRDPRILNGAPEAEEAEAPVVAAVPAPVPGEAVQAAERSFAFVPRKAAVGLILAAVLGVAALALVKAPRAGDPIEIRVNAAQAERASVDYLRARGVPVERYRRVTWLENGIHETATEYLQEHGGVAAATRIYRGPVPVVFWHTRLFQPLKKEEYAVWVTPDGRVFRHAHQLDEKAPGARLEKPEALARAERFLAENGSRTGVTLSEYRLVEDNLEKRDARSDHTLVWEANAKLLADATHRITVAVKGDEVAGPRHWIKIPEQWERKHTRPTLFTILPVVLIVALSLVGLGFFARAIPRTRLHWRMHVGIGGAAALLQLVNLVNAYPAFFESYTTSIPWSTSQVLFAVSGLIGVLFTMAGVAALSAAAETLLSERFGALEPWPDRSPERGRALLEALRFGAAAALVMLGARALVDAGQQAIPTPVRGVSTGLPGYDVSLLPGLAVFTGVLFRALWRALITAALAGLLLRLFRTRLRLVVALLLGTALLASGALSGVHFAVTWASIAINAVVIAAILSTLRFNLASYVVMYVVVYGLGQVFSAWRHPGLEPFAAQAGAGLLALLLLVAAWGLWGVSRGEAAGPDPLAAGSSPLG